MDILNKMIIVFLVVILYSIELSAGARYDGEGRIIITGKGNTLASLAKDIGKPEVFSYDTETRTANCKASISFMDKGGELTIGKKEDPQGGETLRIICDPDGKRFNRNVIIQNATLNIYHSKIIGVNSKIDKNHYRFGKINYYYGGGGEIIGSEINSADMGLQIMTRAPVKTVINNVKCINCGTGLLWSADKTNCVTVDGLDVSQGIKYGVILRLPISRSGPVILRNVDLGNSTVAVDTIGRKHGGSTVLFVNTMVKPNRVWFQEGFGISKIVSAWEQYIRMADFDNNALPDGKLICKSNVKDGKEILPPNVIRMNSAGEAWLPLPVSVITGLDKKVKENPVINLLEAASGTTVFKTVTVNWQEKSKFGWKLERQNDGSWKRISIPYQAPANLTQKVPENLCANGSFETETSPGYPDAWSWWKFFEMKPGGWGIIKPGGKLVRFGLDKKVFYEGKKSLTLPPGFPIYHHPPAGIGTRQLFKGKTYTISFYAKSNKPNSKICLWRWGVPRSQISFTISTEWKRYHVTLKNLKKSGMLCFINAPANSFNIPTEELKGQGRLWLDAVQIEEGDKLHPFMSSNYVCPER